MNPNQQRFSWFGCLLSIVMGIAFVSGGGWVLGRYFVHPEVDAADFRTAEHDGQYIQLNATEAYEVGFQVEYDPSEPGSKDDPGNRVARLIAIPVGTQVLIVRVPMDHRGQSYAGIVKELTFDIEMALAMNDMDNVMRDSRRQIETFLQEAETARRNGFTPGTTNDSATGTFRRTPSLKDLALPVYLDAKEDERWAAGLMIAMGLAFVIGGFVPLLRPHVSPSKDVASPATPLELDRPLTKAGIVEETVTPKGAMVRERTGDEALIGRLTVQCRHGHSFKVDMIYRGAVRKCPKCGEKVEVPSAHSESKSD